MFHDVSGGLLGLFGLKDPRTSRNSCGKGHGPFHVELANVDTPTTSKKANHLTHALHIHRTSLWKHGEDHKTDTLKECTATKLPPSSKKPMDQSTMPKFCASAAGFLGQAAWRLNLMKCLQDAY